MRHLNLLLLVRLREARNTLLAVRPSDLPASAAAVAVFGGFAVAMFFLARTTTVYLLDHVHIGLFLMHRLLSMVFYVLFICVNLGNVIVCHAIFFRSNEAAFLMGMPVPHSRIFFARFVDNVVASSLTLAMIGLALTFGYLSAFGFPWHFYLFTALCVHLPMVILAAALAVGILVSLVAAASWLGAKRLIALTVVLYVGATYFYFRLTNPGQLVNAVVKHFPVVSAYFDAADPPFVRLLPSHWVSQYLYWIIQGEPVKAFPYLLTLWAATAGACFLLWLLARRGYYRSWLAASQNAAPPASGRQEGLAFFRFDRPSLHSREADVMLKRDFWSFFRDPGQWVHLVLMGILLAVFLVSVSTLDMPGSQPMTKTVSFLTLLLFNGFLLASISLRFVFPAVSQEGEALWCLRSAPIDLARVYRRKFYAAFLLVLAVGQLLAAVGAGLTREVFVLMAAGTVTMGCVAMAMTGLHLGAGSVFAQYHERNPVRVASSRGATLTFFLSMMYLVVVTVVLALPVYRFFETLGNTGRPAPGWLLPPLAVVAVLSLAVTATSSLLGVRSFCRDH